MTITPKVLWAVGVMSQFDEKIRDYPEKVEEAYLVLFPDSTANEFWDMDFTHLMPLLMDQLERVAEEVKNINASVSQQRNLAVTTWMKGRD